MNMITRIFTILVVISECYFSLKLMTFKIRLTNVKSAIIDNNENYDNVLIEKLIQTCKQSDKLRVNDLFRTLTTDATFYNQIWQKRPFLCKQVLSNLDQGYVSEDLKTAIDTDFIEAGRGSFEEGKTGWNMKAVSVPKGKSFEEAKLKFDDVEKALKEKSGTVVINSAGGFIPKMAAVCLDSMEAFELPVALNMYVTNPGQRTSAPPHTDKQDVFVLQTQGRKHWRVFSPPPPSRMPRVDPYARGKASDMLDLLELQEPSIDVTLYPGNVLYVPAGFPHTTDTIAGDAAECNQPSLHLTLGVDTHIWDITYVALRSIALKRAGLPDKLVLNKLNQSLFFDLQSTLPTGFLRNTVSSVAVDDSVTAASSTLQPQQQQQQQQQQKLISAEIASIAVKKFRAVEPNRWTATVTDEDIIAELDLIVVVNRLLQHHQELVHIFRTMYHDVAYQVTPVTMNLSFFRSQPYFQALEEIMNELDKWTKEGVKPVSSGSSSTSSGGGAIVTSNNMNTKQNRKSTTKGFGNNK